MLAGKPVVAFVGGAKGVNHLHDAFIVPNHDCEALGQGIITLLEDRALAAESRSQRARHGPGQLRLAADLREDRVHLRQASGGADQSSRPSIEPICPICYPSPVAPLTLFLWHRRLHTALLGSGRFFGREGISNLN